MSAEWFSAAELAALALPGLPGSAANIIATAKRDGWQCPAHKGQWWRPRTARGGGIEYHTSVLPLAARAKLAMDAAPGTLDEIESLAPSDTERAQAWAVFERMTSKKQDAAKMRLSALQDIQRMIYAGVPATLAVIEAARKMGQSKGTLYQWQAMVRRLPERDWLPFLAPRHAGKTGARVDFSEKAWDALRSDWMREEQPTVEGCYRRLQKDAALHGWTIPSVKTCTRRLQAIPAAQRVLAREGEDALKRLYPAQMRDRSALTAMHVLNADFHTWDVRVKWPDGTVSRPSMACFQDIYSGKVLAWRIDHNPTTDGVRLCFGEVVEKFGICAEVVLDNGREFAAKELTGGQKTRYRGKIREEDPEGLFTMLGITVHWATPYSGQSKPIERAFRDMAGDLAKHPRFAGAYTGKDTVSKPSNYGEKSVPLDVFLAVLTEGIAEHNARIGRTGGVCNDRSFDEVFNESYAVSTIKRGTPEQRRLWLLAMDSVMCSQTDGAVRLLGNKFWTRDLTAMRGQRVTVRFDPMDLHAGVHVYRTDGVYLCEAPCEEKVGFLDRDGAREHARKRKTMMKAVKASEALDARMSLADRVALMAKLPEPAPTPEPRVIHGVFGNTARKAMPAAELAEQSDAERAFIRSAQLFQRPLRLVETDGD